MAKYIVVHSVRVCTEFVPETFGRLTTIGPAFLLSRGKPARLAFGVYRCTCGTIGIFQMTSVRRGNTKSCGCLNTANLIERNTTHGRAETSEYYSWLAMKHRCDNENNKNYADYGGRGIGYCDRWKKFENFFADMGKKPSVKHSLDRFPNNDGNYEPSNCRWATQREQCNNNRANKLIIIDGKEDTLANWCRLYGQEYFRVKARLNQLGWEPLRALTSPHSYRKDQA